MPKEFVGVRGNIDEAYACAQFRRRKAQWVHRRIRPIANGRRAAFGAPDFMKDCARNMGEFDDRRQRAVVGDDGVALEIVAGDDTAYRRKRHPCLPLRHAQARRGAVASRERCACTREKNPTAKIEMTTAAIPSPP